MNSYDVKGLVIHNIMIQVIKTRCYENKKYNDFIYT